MNRTKYPTASERDRYIGELESRLSRVRRIAVELKARGEVETAAALREAIGDTNE